MTEVFTGREHRMHYVTSILRELALESAHSNHVTVIYEVIDLIEAKIISDSVETFSATEPVSHKEREKKA